MQGSWTQIILCRSAYSITTQAAWSNRQGGGARNAESVWRLPKKIRTLSIKWSNRLWPFSKKKKITPLNITNYSTNLLHIQLKITNYSTNPLFQLLFSYKKKWIQTITTCIKIIQRSWTWITITTRSCLTSTLLSPTSTSTLLSSTTTTPIFSPSTTYESKPL